ncbi:phosphate:acyl-[acyl carrier protein] acyltransferase [Magnetococcus marinus MC-1]|uniref:Phosphate acyltransferase n=1 Tax=Magnetococcus marinus (strain ATCC BAA-1437 / JCM 17883 / MC-1) TaxID=156889 RepID=PLSX_MAGMM|nr:phosphate acyltransferase PlsX [Magnetococcus marinus]A0L860.1 RecName: Full=Phosphate acyltransferase; AltName: Full=Acyl-ACP phosphotransacylase; AltName: Full=Acyl-[acyl-carrier-protein]--phosphate acyltransferase; AltName: Full=Phosphate-acyl-ACP acyltransferase [Magnetococcus marinus MC-1]ABK44153.1 phosphate:acyl-[acyl carrier protein] acyltransferase [Magnetococcus marinus MC-1]
MTVRIALDAMGGDNAPRAVIEGMLEVQKKRPEVVFTLVGIESRIRQELEQMGVEEDGFRIWHASEVVEMDEKPAVALRTKKDSSMRVGANLVKENQVDAFVSAGNTGALMATAKFVLKTLRGIDRPAIASVIPAVGGETLMLDLGANVDCSSEHLCQFALMGSIFANAVLGVRAPRVGLLNIGEEDTKGNEQVRDAGEQLKARSATLIPGGSYVGNVEGTDIFKDTVDVVVCDGFVGNVSLKSIEGTAKMLTHYLRGAFTKNWKTKLMYLIARPALRCFRDEMDPRKHNGAILLGLNGVVVKSHGGADSVAYAHAIHVAVDLAEKQVTKRIRDAVAKFRAEGTQPSDPAV